MLVFVWEAFMMAFTMNNTLELEKAAPLRCLAPDRCNFPICFMRYTL
jgi:hypothetical protein